MTAGTVDADAAAWRRTIFEDYASARRVARIPGYRVEVLEDVTRHLPAGDDDESLLSFARFAPARADARIEEELRRLRDSGLAAEWKVHDFDAPADLRERLEARGLAADHEEALMVLEVSATDALLPGADDDVRIDVALGESLDAIAAFQEETWACKLPWLAGVLHGMAEGDDPSGTAFIARHGARTVGCGWIDFHQGSRFAQLCGGAVHPEFRGRGLYGRLFARRLALARQRGTPFIAVDAAPMSRPILERKGFRFVCGTYPLRTRPFATGAVTRA